MKFYKTIEIDSVYFELIKIETIQKELTYKFGSEIAKGIIQKLTNGITNLVIDVDFEDTITNYVENNATIITTLTGIGGYGEFPIEIFHFGPLFWVSAQEFDPIKYFKTADEAISCAEFEYNSFFRKDSDED